jgi:hypothetical protein
MGSRANFVIVDRDGWRLRYSHWAATGIASIVAPGPSAAVRFIDAQADGDWLDDVWAEGGALVDLIRRVLLLWGGDLMDDLLVRRAFMRVLALTWPGWTVRWAADGIGDLAAHVGLARATVRNLDPPEPVEPLTDGDSFDLLTVRQADGRLDAYRFRIRFEDHLARFGPTLLGVAGRPGPLPLALPTIPHAGLHLDLAARKAGWWTGGIAPGLAENPAGRWQGWALEPWGDRYEAQLAVCGGLVTVPSPDQAAAIDDLTRCLRSPPSDPVASVRELAARMGADGERVEVTPAALAHVRVEPDAADRARVASALAEVRRELTG